MSNAIFSNALSKAKETLLLGKERLLRMAESPSAEEALKILYETGYGKGEISSAGDYEILNDRETEELNAFVRESSPSEAFKRYFLCDNDYINAEAFIKSKYLKIAADDMLSPNGEYLKAEMKDKIFADDYSSFSENLADALSEGDLLFVENKATGRILGNLFGRAKFNEKRAAAKGAGITSIYDAVADYINVSVALRARNPEVLKDGFVAGGTLTETDKLNFLTFDADRLKEEYKELRSGVSVESAIEAFSKGEPLSEFEKEKDLFALKYLSLKRYDTGGIYPFAYYCFEKENEIRNVRIIMAGLINGDSQEVIKGRIRIVND